MSISHAHNKAVYVVYNVKVKTEQLFGPLDNLEKIIPNRMVPRTAKN